jgi:hypothetical protein
MTSGEDEDRYFADALKRAAAILLADDSRIFKMWFGSEAAASRNLNMPRALAEGRRPTSNALAAFEFQPDLG